MESKGSPTKNTSTTASLVGLAAGLALGSFIQTTSNSTLGFGASVIEPLGLLWVRALRMVVLPLVISQLLVAVVSNRNFGVVGRLSGGAIGIFLVLLALGAGFTIVLTFPMMDFVKPDPGMFSSLQTIIPEAARDAAQSSEGRSFGDWIQGLVPANPIKALVDGNFLQIIIFTLLFAFAVTRISPEPRERMANLFEAFGETMFVMIRWVLKFTPFGVFALALAFSRQTGIGVAGILIQFIVMLCILLLAFTLLLYPIAISVGRIPPKAFVQSLFPGQVVAVSTRSSLASLPALMDGAKRNLDLPKEILGFALPFSASTYKANRTISGPFKLLFLAHVYGIDLEPMQILTFVVTVMILSFSTVGIPSAMTTFSTLPAYLAAGIPLEGYLLLTVVDVIPDIFKTLLNVTGYMTVATTLSRFVKKPEASHAAQTGELVP